MDAAVTSYPDAPAELRAKGAARQRQAGPAAVRLRAGRAAAGGRAAAVPRAGRPPGHRRRLQVLGSVAREQGRYARSVELHAESLAVAEAAGDRWAVASAHGYLAFVSWLQRDFDRAAEEASAALAMFRELGDVEGAAWSLISLGTVARYQGEAERAATLLAESLALSEGIGFREGIAWCCEQTRPARGGRRRPRRHHPAAPQPRPARRAAGPVAHVQRAGGPGGDRAGPGPGPVTRPGCSARPRRSGRRSAP